MAILIMVGLGVLLVGVVCARRLGSGMIGLAVAGVVAIVVTVGVLLILIAIGMHGFP